MQHHVHPMHRARRQWLPAGIAGAQQVPVDVVDVNRRRQLVHGQMAEQRLEMSLDHAAVLT
jgi:hypothetical protein